MFFHQCDSYEFFIVFQDALNDVVIKDLRSNKEGIQHAVLAVDMEMKESE